jgi:lipopolysaccharide transport system ATP-binding protein
MTFSIRCENISKRYKLRTQATGALASIVGTRADYFWALKDVYLEVQPGDRVAIVGRNGSGKSTLLKIFSRITAPTTGFLQFKGRLISLLEIGAGFHNELTGRENIFLNGSIMGMSNKQIKQCYNAIVEFSELEKFIDMPVKYYSSGMSIRLAFSIAAHLECEILIIDEILAVGDAAFQKRCLDKMLEISKQHGRTLLLVSHDMEIVHQICDKAIEMANGRIVQQLDPSGLVFPRPVDEVVVDYLSSVIE